MSFPSFVLQTPHRSVSLTCVFGYGMPISPRMTPAERDLARDMHNRGSTPAGVARHLGRHLSSVTRLLARVGADPRRGRPPALTASLRVFACMRESLQNQINPLIRINP